MSVLRIETIVDNYAPMSLDPTHVVAVLVIDLLQMD